MARMTKEELLEKLFHDDYEHLKGKKLRMTRVRVPGKEVCMAHIISPSDTRIYQNLGGCGGGSRYRDKKCACRDRFYGSFLRLSDYYGQAGRSADCGRRRGQIF